MVCKFIVRVFFFFFGHGGLYILQILSKGEKVNGQIQPMRRSEAG